MSNPMPGAGGGRLHRSQLQVRRASCPYQPAILRSVRSNTIEDIDFSDALGIFQHLLHIPSITPYEPACPSRKLHHHPHRLPFPGFKAIQLPQIRISPPSHRFCIKRRVVEISGLGFVTAVTRPIGLRIKLLMIRSPKYVPISYQLANANRNTLIR